MRLMLFSILITGCNSIPERVRLLYQDLSSPDIETRSLAQEALSAGNSATYFALMQLSQDEVDPEVLSRAKTANVANKLFQFLPDPWARRIIEAGSVLGKLRVLWDFDLNGPFWSLSAADGLYLEEYIASAPNPKSVWDAVSQGLERGISTDMPELLPNRKLAECGDPENSVLCLTTLESKAARDFSVRVLRRIRAAHTHSPPPTSSTAPVM